MQTKPPNRFPTSCVDSRDPLRWYNGFARTTSRRRPLWYRRIYETDGYSGGMCGLEQGLNVVAKFANSVSPLEPSGHAQQVSGLLARNPDRVTNTLKY